MPAPRIAPALCDCMVLPSLELSLQGGATAAGDSPKIAWFNDFHGSGANLCSCLFQLSQKTLKDVERRGHCAGNSGTLLLLPR